MPLSADRFSKIHTFEGVVNTFFFVGLLYLNQVKCGILSGSLLLLI